tara:strand:- start:9885 stop:9989 length:105 start_codon:yes stop_codon:yes gene_type:complete
MARIVTKQRVLNFNHFGAHIGQYLRTPGASHYTA